MSTSDAKTGYQDNPILLESFTGWLERHKVAQASARAYVSDTRRFLQFVASSLTVHDPSAFDDITPAQVEAYRTRLAGSGLHSSTIKRNLMAVRKFFDFLIQQKLVSTNPTTGILTFHILKDVVPTEGLIEAFEYLASHQASPDEPTSLRYQRDELILICIVLFGVRLYQIPTLKPSNIARTAHAITLRVSQRFSVDLHVAFLIKLRTYLTQRHSDVDILFLEPGSKKPVTSKSIQALLVELSCVQHRSCTPASLFHTYLHLQRAPDECRRIWQVLLPARKGAE
jgi:site-specific recombinase XerD